MTENPSLSVTLVCCSVFAKEAESLRQTHWPEMRLRAVDSLLHLDPAELAVQLARVVSEELRGGHRVLLLYGDCCPEMTDWDNQTAVVRTRANNCCELLLGRDEYRRLTHEGAFFLFPEWTRRWERIFGRLGLSAANASDLMRDMHRKLVYLDTGSEPVPQEALRACAEFCHLPCELRPVPLEGLRRRIQDALDRLLHPPETIP